MSLARRYHERCDKYDQAVCTGRVVNGVRFPRTKKELKRVKYNTEFELQWMIDVGELEVNEVEDFIKAIKLYERASRGI